MLDTVMLCGNCNDFSDEKPRGPLHMPSAHRQLAWLQGRLARSKADFLLVAGHYPVWSVSEHGPTACLLRKLHPLLIKHRATAYLCGHDHNLQVRSRVVENLGYERRSASGPAPSVLCSTFKSLAWVTW